MKRLFCCVAFFFASFVTAQEHLQSIPTAEFWEAKIEKPEALPLTISVERDCPVGEEVVRDSVEQALARGGIETEVWPRISGHDPWFGLLVEAECEIGSRFVESRMWFRVAFVDSIDNKLQTYGQVGAEFGYGGNRFNGHEHEGAITKARLPGWVSNITRRTVEQFLRERFLL